MKTEYWPFRSDMIPEAGGLLAKRHICNRRILPLLLERYEDPQAANRLSKQVDLMTAWARPQ